MGISGGGPAESGGNEGEVVQGHSEQSAAAAAPTLA